MSTTTADQPAVDNLPPYLSSTHLTKLFGVSRPTINAWARNGRLPAPLPLGPRTLRWPRDVILKHLEALQKKGGES